MDVMGIYYKGNIMGNTSHMRQEMKRSNTNLGFDIDVTNGEWDLESTNMIRMVYIKVGQSPQIVNGLDYGKTCMKPYKKKYPAKATVMGIQDCQVLAMC